MESLLAVKKNKGSAAAGFKIKECKVGKKMSGSEQNVILDPETKLPALSWAKITKVCADNVQNLLASKDRKEEYKLDIEMKRKVHELRMNERHNDELDLTNEMLNKMNSVEPKEGKSTISS